MATTISEMIRNDLMSYDEFKDYVDSDLDLSYYEHIDENDLKRAFQMIKTGEVKSYPDMLRIIRNWNKEEAYGIYCDSMDSIRNEENNPV